MDGLNAYQIEIQGRVEGNDLNSAGPLRLSVVSEDEAASVLAVRTDQSGLIGLLRHLHGRGVILISVRCGDPSLTPPHSGEEPGVGQGDDSDG